MRHPGNDLLDRLFATRDRWAAETPSWGAALQTRRKHALTCTNARNLAHLGPYSAPLPMAAALECLPNRSIGRPPREAWRVLFWHR